MSRPIVAVVPPTALLLYPAPLKFDCTDPAARKLTAEQKLWNSRVRDFYEGAGR